MLLCVYPIFLCVYTYFLCIKFFDTFFWYQKLFVSSQNRTLPMQSKNKVKNAFTFVSKYLGQLISKYFFLTLFLELGSKTIRLKKFDVTQVTIIKKVTYRIVCMCEIVKLKGFAPCRRDPQNQTNQDSSFLII